MVQDTWSCKQQVAAHSLPTASRRNFPLSIPFFHPGTSTLGFVLLTFRMVIFSFHQLISLEMASQTHLASDSQVIVIPRKLMNTPSQHVSLACYIKTLLLLASKLSYSAPKQYFSPQIRINTIFFLFSHSVPSLHTLNFPIMQYFCSCSMHVVFPAG